MFARGPLKPEPEAAAPPADIREGYVEGFSFDPYEASPIQPMSQCAGLKRTPFFSTRKRLDDAVDAHAWPLAFAVINKIAISRGSARSACGAAQHSWLFVLGRDSFHFPTFSWPFEGVTRA